MYKIYNESLHADAKSIIPITDRHILITRSHLNINKHAIGQSTLCVNHDAKALSCKTRHKDKIKFSINLIDA